MRGGADRHPIPLVMVEYKKTPSKPDIFELREILDLKVKIEAPHKKNNTSQCYRCQQFKHTSAVCHLPPKCLKCAGNHLTMDCLKPVHATPKCANCGGPHPANFNGCSRHPSRKNPTTYSNPALIQPSLPPLLNSFSNALKTNNGNQTKVNITSLPSPTIPVSANTATSLSAPINLSAILDKIMKIVPILERLEKFDLDKFQAISTLISTIN